jgi:4-alpha-glucanotransferase
VFRCAFVHSTVLLPASIAKAYPFAEGHRCGGDELPIRLALQHQRRLGNVPQALIKYRHHAGQRAVVEGEAIRADRREIQGRVFRWLFPDATPADEAAQTRLGERVLQVLREAGAEIVAEDLGVVPAFVRESLTRLSVPGYRVLRWERRWDADGQPFTDPLDYPAVAVATSGTHDTEPMAVWWEGAPPGEREAVLAIPSVRARLSDDAGARALGAPGLPDELRDALVESLYASGADTLMLPIQDVFGWRDRINQPATVNASNWTWRLPWLSDRLSAEPDAAAAAAARLAAPRLHGRH